MYFDVRAFASRLEKTVCLVLEMLICRWIWSVEQSLLEVGRRLHSLISASGLLTDMLHHTLSDYTRNRELLFGGLHLLSSMMATVVDLDDLIMVGSERRA